MGKHSNWLWITGLLLGGALDLLFWKQPLGLNFGLYAILCVLGGTLVLARNRQYPARGALPLFALILLFAAVAAVRAEPLTVFLAVCVTLLLMAVLSNTYLGGRWLRYGPADYIGGALRLIASMLGRPARLRAERRREQQEAGAAGKGPNVWPVVRGAALAVPILAVFAALLASADAEFSRELDAFLRVFRIENLPQIIFRGAYILIGAYLLVGVFLHASTQSRDESPAGGRKPLVPPFLGFTEAAIVLGSVAVLFTAFVVVQFRYFFGGAANITVAGFTYAEYARRGFGELVTVAFFSLLLILGLEAATRRESAAQRRTFSALGTVIVALVLVMLVSAYQRLALYESAYGFSRLRTYTHVALVWIGLLLAAVAVLEIAQRRQGLAPAMLIAVLGFALSLAALDVDRLIVQQNVERAMRGEELDVPYLVSLSSDSIPALAGRFESPSTPPAVRDGVGAALFCRWEIGAQPSERDWRGFTFSRWQAEAAMQRVLPQVKGYRLLESDWPMRIGTPAGATYNCRGSGLD